MFYQPSKRIIALYLIRCALLLLSAAVVFRLLSVPNGEAARLLLLLVAAAVVLLAFLWQYRRNYGIKANKKAIIIKSGAMFKRTRVAAYNGCGYIQAISTPAARLLRLKALIIRLPQAVIFVPELENSEAEEILKSIWGIEKPRSCE